MMYRLLFLVAAASIVRAQNDSMALFDTLWAQFSPMADENGDGKIQRSEIPTLFRKLDITQDQVRAACSCNYDELVTTYDADGDNALSAAEIIELANQNQQLGQQLIAAVGNAPDPEMANSVMEDAMNPSTTLVAAAAQVAKSFTVSGAQIYPGDRRAIGDYFLALWGVSTDQLIVTYEQVGATAATRMSRRKLQQTEWTVTARAFVADQATADAAGAAADTALADPAASSAALGVTVTTVAPAASTPVTGMKEMPMMSFALIILAVIFPLMTCIGGCMTSSASRKKTSAASEGCMKNGCCSNEAIISWSGMLLLVAIVLLIACFMLYGQMSAFINAIKSIIRTLLLASNGTGEMATMAAELPTEVIDQVQSQIDLLGIAVILPGVVSGVLLIIIAICGFAKKKGGFCGAKCVIMLSYIFLLLSFITYIVCMAMAVVMFVPTTQEMLRQYLVICDTTVPVLAQTLADAQASLDTASAAGMAAAVAEAQPQVDQATEAVTLMRGLCTGIQSMIAAIEGLLEPSVLAFSMVIAAFWTDFGTCCAMGCCKSPHSAKTAPA